MNKHTPSRSVLITGCSTGIGHCLAHGLKRRGYHVIASCRKDEDVEKLTLEGFQSLKIDLANESQVDEAVNTLRDMTGDTLYGLINNGAYGQPGALIDVRRDVLREQFETNVFGTQQLTNGLLSVMLPRAEGRIIQISSILGFVCLRFRGSYNASKYALEALTDTMRLEHRGSGLFFSLIQPGPIRSQFQRNALNKYLEHIDSSNSIFQTTYPDIENRLRSSEESQFTLPPEAVLKVVIHALESRRPKIRYPVTVPTKVMAILKRGFSDRWLDAFLDHHSDRLVTNRNDSR